MFRKRKTTCLNCGVEFWFASPIAPLFCEKEECKKAKARRKEVQRKKGRKNAKERSKKICKCGEVFYYSKLFECKKCREKKEYEIIKIPYNDVEKVYDKIRIKAQRKEKENLRKYGKSFLIRSINE